MKTMRYINISIFLILLQNIALGQESDIINIERTSHSFSYNLVEGNYDSLVALYTSDAKIFPTNQDILEGDGLRDYWMAGKESGSKVTYHKSTPKEIRVLGNEAYDWGYYEGKSVEDGKETSWRGKYVIIWKKENYQWKMYLDIWNRIQE